MSQLFKLLIGLLGPESPKGREDHSEGDGNTNGGEKHTVQILRIVTVIIISILVFVLLISGKLS